MDAEGAPPWMTFQSDFNMFQRCVSLEAKRMSKELHFLPTLLQSKHTITHLLSI